MDLWPVNFIGSKKGVAPRSHTRKSPGNSNSVIIRQFNGEFGPKKLALRGEEGKQSEDPEPFRLRGDLSQSTARSSAVAFHPNASRLHADNREIDRKRSFSLGR